jgi:hypothetical protein
MLEEFSDLSRGASIPVLSDATWAIRSQEISALHHERLVRLDESMVGSSLLEIRIDESIPPERDPSGLLP